MLQNMFIGSSSHTARAGSECSARTFFPQMEEREAGGNEECRQPARPPAGFFLLGNQRLRGAGPRPAASPRQNPAWKQFPRPPAIGLLRLMEPRAGTVPVSGTATSATGWWLESSYRPTLPCIAAPGDGRAPGLPRSAHPPRVLCRAASSACWIILLRSPAFCQRA